MTLRGFSLWAGLLGLAPCGQGPDAGDAGETKEECPGTEDAPCNEDPWVCEAGQTCWLSGASMTCLTVGPGRQGEICSAGGTKPTCGEHLMCARFTGQPEGHCRQFCVPDEPCKACPQGLTCAAVNFGGAVDTNLCLPP